MNVHNEQRPYLISFGILKKEVEKFVEEKSLCVEPYFLDLGLHETMTSVKCDSRY